jgi:hypothetical protein
MDSGAEAEPRKNRRSAKRDAAADISPVLREHITQAAQEVLAAHKAELADGAKADSAARLFRGILRRDGKRAASFQVTPGVPVEGMAALVGELGALLSDAIHAGTGLWVPSLTVMAQEWVATMESAAKPDLGRSCSDGAVPMETSPPQPSAAPQLASTAVDTTTSGFPAPEAPAASPEEVRLRRFLNQFMPMIVKSLNQGGDGYGLAATVIALFGRSMYNQAAGLGKDKVMQIVRAEPDLWSEVAPIEAKFSRFLDEFRGYDAWTEEQARLEVGE